MQKQPRYEKNSKVQTAEYQQKKKNITKMRKNWEGDITKENRP